MPKVNDDGQLLHVKGRMALPFLIPVGSANAATLQELTHDLNSRFTGQGTFSDKTVRRYLEELSADPVLQVRQDGKAYRYYLQKPLPALNEFNLSEHMALALILISEVAAEQLPPEVLEEVRSLVDNAKGRLKRSTRIVGLRDWMKRFKVIPGGMWRKAPQVDPEIRKAFYQAVRERKPVTCEYHAIGKDKAARWHLSPLALIFMGQQTYVVCVDCEGRWPKPRSLPLSRFREATIDPEQTFRSPATFDLDTFVRHRNPVFPISDQRIGLVLKLAPATARYQEERPIAEDQRLEPIPGSDWVRLTATVSDDQALRNWLRTLASDVEVMEPIKLRAEFTELARTLADRYVRRD